MECRGDRNVYGYKILIGSERYFVIDDLVAAVVRKIFQWVLDGKNIDEIVACLTMMVALHLRNMPDIMKKLCGKNNIFNELCGIPKWLEKFLEIKCIQGYRNRIVGKVNTKMEGANREREATLRAIRTEDTMKTLLQQMNL